MFISRVTEAVSLGVVHRGQLEDVYLRRWTEESELCRQRPCGLGVPSSLWAPVLPGPSTPQPFRVSGDSPEAAEPHPISSRVQIAFRHPDSQPFSRVLAAIPFWLWSYADKQLALARGRLWLGYPPAQWSWSLLRGFCPPSPLHPRTDSCEHLTPEAMKQSQYCDRKTLCEMHLAGSL